MPFSSRCWRMNFGTLANIQARSVSVLALPPHHYGTPKGMYWNGVKEHDRFPPTYPDQEYLLDNDFVYKESS